MCQDKLRELDAATNDNRKIVYLDELNFTKKSIALREWSTRNSNLCVAQNDIYVGYRSVIASMTEERGFCFLRVKAEAINGDDFADYLKGLRRKHPKRRLALFMDNLAVHKAQLV